MKNESALPDENISTGNIDNIYPFQFAVACRQERARKAKSDKTGRLTHKLFHTIFFPKLSPHLKGLSIQKVGSLVVNQFYTVVDASDR